MSKRWRVHAETLAEIDATAEWYGEQRADLDLEFLADLRITLTALRAAPGASAPDPTGRTDAHVRRRRLNRFPYAVVIAESATEYAGHRRHAPAPKARLLAVAA